MKKIVFTATGCCSAIGNFAPGDTARLGDAIARHLVEEAGCAKYAEVAVVEVSAAEESPTRRKGRRA